jgi:hypothetical protein
MAAARLDRQLSEAERAEYASLLRLESDLLDRRLQSL